MCFIILKYVFCVKEPTSPPPPRKNGFFNSVKIYLHLAKTPNANPFRGRSVAARTDHVWSATRRRKAVNKEERTRGRRKKRRASLVFASARPLLKLALDRNNSPLKGTTTSSPEYSFRNPSESSTTSATLQLFYLRRFRSDRRGYRSRALVAGATWTFCNRINYVPICESFPIFAGETSTFKLDIAQKCLPRTTTMRRSDRAKVRKPLTLRTFVLR